MHFSSAVHLKSFEIGKVHNIDDFDEVDKFNRIGRM